MDESSSLKVIAVRAIETADGARTLWSDDDRAWASRAAAEVVGADAAPESFVERRAALVVDKLGARQPALLRTLRALRWRPWVGGAIVAIAFALGVFLDQVARAQQINILAPPVLGLLAWNLAVYVVMVTRYIVRYGDDTTDGPLRRAVAFVAGGSARPRRIGGAAMRDALSAFVADWAQRSAPLYGSRAARILHFAAATLSAGVIAGLYLRGLGLEYRASWQSTFLEAPTVHAIVAFAYAPGSLLIGIPVPDVDAVAAIRAPAGAIAALWIHLMAATVAVIVLAPRLLLALLAGMVERHRAARLPLPLAEPYFQRLLRGFSGGPSRVRVIPFSYTPSADALAGLESIVARTFGGSAAMIVSAPVAYGDEFAVAHDATTATGSALVALFNSSATPEREVQGAFLQALAASNGGVNVLVALIDEGSWSARWRNEPSRITDRRAAWQRLGEQARVPVVFADLSAPDLAGIEQSFDRAMANDAG
ncbi:MAG: DUF2868 domain-containing protein [Betaproteobacteria bacterium]